MKIEHHTQHVDTLWRLGHRDGLTKCFNIHFQVFIKEKLIYNILFKRYSVHILEIYLVQIIHIKGHNNKVTLETHYMLLAS